MSRSDETPAADNHVFLRGRLADAPTFRELPSGDVLASFRVTVARPPGTGTRVDSIECSTDKARVQKTLGRAGPGDDLEVVGSLHRRFWRTSVGVASRYAVEVQSVRLTRVGRRVGASRGRTPASA